MTEPTGFTAVGMVGFTDKGTYSASASYVKNDLVHYGGSIWCCLIDDTTGIEPRNDSANWEVFIDYSDLSNIKSDFLSLGYINQIPYPYSEKTKTNGGVTFTVNEDKSITVNGTGADWYKSFYLARGVNLLEPGDYAVSCGVDIPTESKLKLQIGYKEGNSDLTKKEVIAKNESYFTISSNWVDKDIFIRLTQPSTATIDNITVYPYIRKLTDGKSNRQLTEEVTQNSSDIQTLTNNVAKCETLVVSVASFSALPQTITNANIEDDMVVVNSVLSNPSAQTGDWTVTTSSGSLTISGSISGTTTATLYLMKSR